MTISELKDYKGDLYKAMSRDLTEFEKNFLFISSGLLAFSITFIKDIVKVDHSIYLSILFLGWALIIVAISLMMYAFLKSAWDSDSLWKMADEYILNNNFHQDTIELTADQWKDIRTKLNNRLYKSKKYLKMVRSTAVIFFIAGLFSFATYVGKNLLNESKAQKGNTQICNPKK